MKVRVKDARKALQKRDQQVTQLTASLKQCRKEVWDLQCEANAADLKARHLSNRSPSFESDEVHTQNRGVLSLSA